jgi:hypothetical protein
MNVDTMTNAMTRTICVMLTGAALSAACVTINIYFPAAAAEKAADRIIDEVWQLKKEQDSKAQPEGSQQ